LLARFSAKSLCRTCTTVFHFADMDVEKLRRSAARQRVSSACKACRSKKLKCIEKFRPCTRCLNTAIEAICQDEGALRISRNLVIHASTGDDQAHGSQMVIRNLASSLSTKPSEQNVPTAATSPTNLSEQNNHHAAIKLRNHLSVDTSKSPGA
jgi:hypothetical protein